MKQATRKYASGLAHVVSDGRARSRVRMLRLVRSRTSFTIGRERHWTDRDAFVDGGGYLYWPDVVKRIYSASSCFGHVLAPKARRSDMDELSRAAELALIGDSPND
jgi:hypothetical protein